MPTVTEVCRPQAAHSKITCWSPAGPLGAGIPIMKAVPEKNSDREKIANSQFCSYTTVTVRLPRLECG